MQYFTPLEKQTIINYAIKHGNTAASKKFNVSRRSIAFWRNPEIYQKEKQRVKNNENLKAANRARALKNYRTDTEKRKKISKQSRQKRKFKRLVEMSNRFFSRDQWLTAFDLFCIAKKQRLLCALTGEKLTNETISVDHIIPKSKGGSNKPSNIRLVHKDVNLARRALTDEEFLTLCKKVVSHLSPRPD